MSVVRVDPLKVTGEIPEKMAPWIKVGQPVELHVDAYPDKAITGKMSRISPAVNTATRAFPFEALVPNDGALLKPGTFARVSIATNKVDHGADAARTPRCSTATASTASSSSTATSSSAQRAEGRRSPRRSHRDRQRRQAGEPVALTDVDKLVDGMKVNGRRRRQGQDRSSTPCSPNSASAVRSSRRCS